MFYAGRKGSRHHKSLGKSGPELGKPLADFVTYLQL